MSEHIAAVEIPDTRLVTEATELVREAASPLIYHHSRRVYLFGALRGREQGWNSTRSCSTSGRCSTTSG